eukprot:jgi/Botrbrau1/11727/Bobra.0195s0054.1
MGTPGKKGKVRQADLTVLFAKARDNNAKNATPPKVLSTCRDQGDKLTDHHGQSLKYPAHHHNDQISKRRQQQEFLASKASAHKRQRFADDDLPELATGGSSKDDGWGDESGWRYLTLLQHFLTKTTKPNTEEFQQLMTLLRTHGLHSDKNLSVHTYRILQLVQDMFPNCKIHTEDSGSSVRSVLEDPGVFSFLERKFRQTNDPYKCQRVDNPEASLPFKVFQDAVSALHNMCLGIDDSPTYEVRCNDVGAMFGEVYFLKYVVSQLYLDLRVRLHVFKESLALKGPDMQSRRQTLLTTSLLWRLFSSELGCVDFGREGGDMQLLVTMLMEIIGSASVDNGQRPLGQTPEEAKVNWMEMGTVSPAEAASLAALLLNMLLELYGVAEDQGMFHQSSKGRTSSNIRMHLDSWMHDCFAGSKSLACFRVGEPMQPCKAFLESLNPRDCQRFIALLFCKRMRDKQASSHVNALQQMKVLYDKPGEVERYVTVDPHHVLGYVADNHVACLCYLDIAGADGLVVLVTQFVQACIKQNLSRQKSAVLLPIMEDVAKKLMSDHYTKGLTRHELQVSSLVDLAAACEALAC